MPTVNLRKNSILSTLTPAYNLTSNPMGNRMSRLRGSQRESRTITNPSPLPESEMATPSEPLAKDQKLALPIKATVTNNSPTIQQLEMAKPGKSLVGHEEVASTEFTDLPSQIEETLAPCPRFRIVLVGNTGVGKSSLVGAVFNISLSNSRGDSDNPSDIAHDRAGKAAISHGYYSDQNPRFILHDSMGFEPGSTEKSEIVKSFLRGRAEPRAKLLDQVHAIWLCIETPRTGARLLQTGDEELLELAKELKIPVIVVLTKYDRLVMEHFRACSHISSRPHREAEASTRAEKVFKEVTKELNVPFVPVSMEKMSKGTTLLELTKVTRDHLPDTVKGPLWALWATAQQVNARQKVELSIREGFKKYWSNLGESVVFQGHMLGQCIERIHDDILKVWNLNDPEKLLSKTQFLEGMLGLVEPLRDGQVVKTPQANEMADLAANVATAAGAVGSSVVLPALVTIAVMKGFQFLLGTYQKGASTATYLAAYIVDLTLVLYDISITITGTEDPPRILSNDLVMDALAMYKSNQSLKIHDQVKDVALSPKLEERIAKVIQASLHK